MDSIIKSKWLKALRSGKYTKTTGILREVDEEGSGDYHFCCLGVLCDITGKGSWRQINTYEADNDSSSLWLPTPVMQHVGLENCDPCVRITEAEKEKFLTYRTEKFADPVGSLAEHEQEELKQNKIKLSILNDNGFSFAEIADMIERSL